MDRAAPSADELLAHADWLHRLARVLVGDASADDVVQETYAVAITKPPANDGELRPWLGGVARNLAKMTLRGRGRRTKHEERAASEVSTEVPSSESLVERARMHQRVAAIVLELPDTLRDVLLLRFFEGMTAADIARAQDIPGATVRSRLAEALARVRDALDTENNGDRNRWAVLLSPLPNALTSGKAATGVLAGGLIVKLKLGIALIVLALVALFGTRMAGLWGGKPSAQQPVAATTGSGSSAKTAPPTPTPFVGVASAVQRRVEYDYEPPGTARLEGQVIDETDKPVGGVKVYIDTMVPRFTVSEPDGSFVFEDVAPRTFELLARAEKKVAGPVRVRVTDKTEPVTLRLRVGGLVEITMTDADTGKPIAGHVELRAPMTEFSARCNADGKATLEGIPALWVPLVGKADGYAQSGVMVGTSGDPASPTHVALAMRKGAMISGTLRDSAGKPLAGGRVIATSASEPFPIVDMRDHVKSQADGTYRVGPVTAGTWRIRAAAAKHPDTTSAPVSVDGEHERTGIDLVLEDGVSLGGTVVDAAGKPVVAAEVKVVVRGSTVWRAALHTVTDGTGAFALTGLPQRAVDIVASHDTGATDIVPLDLTGKREARTTLTIAISGAVAGTVVDAQNQPIGDAQVLVEPVWTGGTADRAAWSVRGSQLAITDQGGAFRIAGLPNGEYTVRASRSGTTDAALELAKPVSATVTSSEGAPIRIVLTGDGSITGKVELADGTTPSSFTISLGGTSPIPFATPDGSFKLPAIAGTHQLVVDGRRFLASKVKEVTVETGKVASVGTIVVQPGRSVRGRVLDEAGVPIAGATVAAGSMLTGGGSELYIADESPGAKDATTDERGQFALDGFSPAPITILAGKESFGRSASLRLPAGPDSATVDLVVRRTAGLEGTITRDGKPLADTIVIANPIGAAQSNFFVQTGPDGTFVLDALAPGAYVVYPMIGGGGSKPKDMYIKRVEVASGTARTKVTIDASPGPVTMALDVKTDAGAVVPAAMVFAVSADIPVPTTTDGMRDIDQLGGFGTKLIPLFMRAAMGGPVELVGVPVGPLVVCAMPMPKGPGERDERIACTKLAITVSTKDGTLTVPAAWFAAP